MSEILTEADTREIEQRTQDRREWADGKKPEYEFAYTLDERRVVDYILTMTDNSIGGGDDPIGFLIASHQFLAVLRKDAERMMFQYGKAVHLKQVGLVDEAEKLRAECLA